MKSILACKQTVTVDEALKHAQEAARKKRNSKHRGSEKLNLQHHKIFLSMF
jgi:hypothetical protein